MWHRCCNNNRQCARHSGAGPNRINHHVVIDHSPRGASPTVASVLHQQPACARHIGAGPNRIHHHVVIDYSPRGASHTVASVLQQQPACARHSGAGPNRIHHHVVIDHRPNKGASHTVAHAGVASTTGGTTVHNMPARGWAPCCGQHTTCYKGYGITCGRDHAHHSECKSAPSPASMVGPDVQSYPSTQREE